MTQAANPGDFQDDADMNTGGSEKTCGTYSY